MDAEAYTVQPEGVTANAILLAAGDLGPAAALKTLRDIAPRGSGAESCSDSAARIPHRPAVPMTFQHLRHSRPPPGKARRT